MSKQSRPKRLDLEVRRRVEYGRKIAVVRNRTTMCKTTGHPSRPIRRRLFWLLVMVGGFLFSRYSRIPVVLNMHEQGTGFRWMNRLVRVFKSDSSVSHVKWKWSPLL